LYDLPVTYSQEPGADGSPVPFGWDDTHGARLGLLPREGGDADVLWIEIDPCYVFHPVNAYETGRHIVIDVIRHERVFDFGPGREAGEAVFVPREPGAAEADGYLLTFVYDAAADRSDLVVVDTADFTGPPVAVVQLPVRVPHGAHAAWVTGD